MNRKITTSLLMLLLLVPLSVQNLKISPVLECVEENGDGTYTAHFGYYNHNSVPVNIPVSNNNKFTPGWDLNQQTVFQPGRVVDDFQVEFDGAQTVLSKLKALTTFSLTLFSHPWVLSQEHNGMLF